jgi:thymidine kinase
MKQMSEQTYRVPYVCGCGEEATMVLVVDDGVSTGYSSDGKAKIEMNTEYTFTVEKDSP